MFVNQVHRVMYVAKNYQTGLTNITMRVTKPDKSLEGLFTLIEFDPTNRPGHYIYDYTPTEEGNYDFSVYEGAIHKFTKSELSWAQDFTHRPVMEF